MTFFVPEKYRLRTGPFATSEADGNNGIFFVKLPHNQTLKVIASDGGVPGGQRWEHVSVSRVDRCPIWDEMCMVKDLFWSPDTCVVQYMVPVQDHISNHSFCLHMWCPVGVELPRPLSIMVGDAALGTLA